MIGTIFLLTINMCDRGRTITHLQISRFHTQVWYNMQNTGFPFLHLHNIIGYHWNVIRLNTVLGAELIICGAVVWIILKNQSRLHI